jgi:hypothetical protein
MKTADKGSATQNANAGHTRGPWKLTQYGAVVDDHGQTVVYTDNGESCINGDANARLIAAAPDLLAACKGMLLQIDPCPDGVPMSARCRVCGNHPTKHKPDCVVLVARAAIARAEGGAA